MRALMISVVLALAGCSGGGGDGDVQVDGPHVQAGSRACDYIYGGGTTTLVTPGCASCTVTNEAAAIDGDLDTYAQIRWPADVGGPMARPTIPAA